MATINIDNFGGIAPRIHPTLLKENMATVAHNCLLKSGKLVPIRQPAPLSLPVAPQNGLLDISDARTIHIWRMKDGKKRILAWPGKVYVAESNLSVDPNSRLFVSGETGVGGSGEGGNRPCAIIDAGDGRIDAYDMTKTLPPAPAIGDYDVARREIIAHHAADQANERYAVFFQAWVDEYGYESGLSPASQEVAYNDKETVYAGAWTDTPPRAVKRRFYQSVSGSEETQVRFIAEQTKSASVDFFSVFQIRLSDEDAGEAEPSILSPADDLEMICKVPGNFYAGVRRSNVREVRFSEAGNPSNWPDEYTASVYDDIVGLGVTLNTVFAITKSRQWAVSGSSPDAMTASVLATDEGCVSADSICAHNGAVFYASPNGLCMLQDGAASVSVITRHAYSRREWQSLGPETCRVAGVGGTLFCWFDEANPLAICLNDDADAAITTHDEMASAVCVDREAGRIVFVR